MSCLDAIYGALGLDPTKDTGRDALSLEIKALARIPLGGNSAL